MSDEEAFLRAISAEPDDPAVRLVYADFLEERGDPRAAFVRFQADASDASPDRLRREEEWRAEFDPYWLARLDPPVWCVVGNVVGEHAFGPGGAEVRQGTRLFRPNAKVFLANLQHGWALFEAPGEMAVIVVGQHRKSRAWIQSYVRAAYLTNWRVQLIHHPGTMVRLHEEGWPGFLLRRGDFECPEDRQSPEAVNALLRAVAEVALSRYREEEAAE